MTEAKITTVFLPFIPDVVAKIVSVGRVGNTHAIEQIVVEKVRSDALVPPVIGSHTKFYGVDSH